MVQKYDFALFTLDILLTADILLLVSLYAFMSPCHLVILSYCYLVTLSSCHLIISSLLVQYIRSHVVSDTHHLSPKH